MGVISSLLGIVHWYCSIEKLFIEPEADPEQEKAKYHEYTTYKVEYIAGRFSLSHWNCEVAGFCEH